MKKFFNEFKEFALKGNVLDLAIAVVIGAAFGKVVSSLVDIFIQPLVDAINHAISPDVEAATIPGKLVAFAGVLIEFILVALVLFLIVKAANKAKNMKKKPEEKPEEPTTKECPYCLSEVPIKATRCPHCTSELQFNPASK
ncbi:MAG: large conductance mechanosensitive channel protein MscL [Clostridia bacterium]|nr:large conductance mechanosensitive channel protein MscL [Clostridia bacterium]